MSAATEVNGAVWEAERHIRAAIRAGADPVIALRIWRVAIVEETQTKHVHEIREIESA